MVKFRYDFLNDEEHPYQIMNALFGPQYPCGVLGVESNNACGAVIKRHFHFHFCLPADDDKESVRKRFIRNYKLLHPELVSYPPNSKEGTITRGRGWYSLKVETDVEDNDRFFRYCVKQIPPEKFNYEFTRIPLPAGLDLKFQNILAYEEWSKGREILTKKAIKDGCRMSTYEKILDIIQKTSPVLNSVRDCRRFVLAYYKENAIPPNRGKIYDIADGIALLQGVIDEESYLGG